MKHSPLDEKHKSLGAKMADFGGWEMPIEYPGGGVLAEHDAVRNKVGIFDVSHLGKISVKGAGAKDFINSVLTNDLNKIVDGEAQYNLLCNEQGGVIDDIIAYRNGDNDIFLVPNAANCSSVEAVIRSKAPSNLKIENEDDVSLHNRSYMHYVANHIELVSTKCWATKWLLENIIESDKEYSVREYMSGIGIQTLLIQKLFNVNKHTISELDENCIKHLSLLPFDVKPEILHENAEESLLKNDNSDLKFLDLAKSFSKLETIVHVKHQASNCQSTLLHKGLYTDQSRGFFKAMVGAEHIVDD